MGRWISTAFLIAVIAAIGRRAPLSGTVIAPDPETGDSAQAKQQDSLRINNRIAIFTAVAAIGSLITALVAACSSIDSHNSIVKENAPALFLTCAEAALPFSSPDAQYVYVTDDVDVPIYRALKIFPEPGYPLPLQAKVAYRCDLDNVGKLAAVDIHLGFRVYYYAGSNWPPQKYYYDYLELPGALKTEIGGLPPETINLAPGEHFFFALGDISAANADVQPLTQGQITIPGAGATCAPIYLSFNTLLRGFLPNGEHGKSKTTEPLSAGNDVRKESEREGDFTRPLRPASTCLDASDSLGRYLDQMSRH